MARKWRTIPPPWQGAGASLAILRRELVVTLRGWRPAVIAALTCALATYLLLSFWPPTETDLRKIGEAPVQIVIAVSLVLLGASYIALPGLAASAILAERQQQTFDLLKLSLIPPLWVVFAKLMNCVGYFLLLLAAVVPILAASFYLVGIDIQQFGAVVLMLIVHAFACSAAGLAASAFARRPFSAIALSYILIAAISGIPTAIVSENLNMGSEELAALTCPGFGIVFLLSGQIVIVEYLYALPLQLAFFAFFFVITIVMTRRPERVAQEDQSKILDDPAQLAARRKQFPFYLIDPLRRRPDIPDGKNPMRIKELSWGLLGREARMIRICYVTFTFMFCFSLYFADSVETWVIVQFVMLLMFAPAFVTSAVSKEYEQGNMDLLRITLLNGRELLQGKLWAAALSLAPFLFGLFVGGVPVILYHSIYSNLGRADMVVRFYPLLLSFTMVVLAVGLLSSILLRRTVAATVCSYAIAAGILFAAPVLMVLTQVATLEGAERFAFMTPIGFIIRNQYPGKGTFAIDADSEIALQCCILLAIALVTLRLSEIIFVRTRMQDR